MGRNGVHLCLLLGFEIDTRLGRNPDQKVLSRNFPDGQVVRNLPSNAGDASWIPSGELRSHVLWGNYACTAQLERSLCSSGDLLKSESESCSVVSDSLQPHGLHNLWHSPGQNTGVGIRFLLQGTFPTQELNQGLLHCGWILYQLSYQGSPDAAK